MSASVSLHPRDIRARIWQMVLCATDQEIRDGLDFYPGAYGLCRLLGGAFGVEVSQVAGIYAALSPMNTWDTNVANVIEVLRWNRNGARGFLPRVNTTQPNQVKAVRIVRGERPLDVLKGSKVRAFYLAINDPSDVSPIAVDRHLFTAACGIDHTPQTGKSKLSRMASDRELYTKVESAYRYIGNREGLGNRIASIVWFVQRRIVQGQMIELQPSMVICCNRPMHRIAARSKWQCGGCKRSKSFSSLDARELLDGFKVGMLNGRKIVHVGKSHPFANSGGWQYVARYQVMKDLKRRLETDEHAHHKNNVKTDDSKPNIQLLLAESHGQHHRYLADLAGYRDELGRFTEWTEPLPLTSN